jgi:hypothetical protein
MASSRRTARRAGPIHFKTKCVPRPAVVKPYVAALALAVTVVGLVAAAVVGWKRRIKYFAQQRRRLRRFGGSYRDCCNRSRANPRCHFMSVRGMVLSQLRPLTISSWLSAARFVIAEREFSPRRSPRSRALVSISGLAAVNNPAAALTYYSTTAQVTSWNRVPTNPDHASNITSDRSGLT